MAKKTKFVLNRKNFRDQILKGDGTQGIITELLGEKAAIDVTPRGDRVRGRVYGSMADEAKNGTLSRKLGSI